MKNGGTIGGKTAPPHHIKLELSFKLGKLLLELVIIGPVHKVGHLLHEDGAFDAVNFFEDFFSCHFISLTFCIEYNIDFSFCQYVFLDVIRLN